MTGRWRGWAGLTHKGIDVVREIRDNERGGKASVVIIGACVSMQSCAPRTRTNRFLCVCLSVCLSVSLSVSVSGLRADGVHGGAADDGDKDDKFFEELGGRGPVAAAADDDEAYEKKKAAQLKLYRVRPAPRPVSCVWA
jgi:hypothetical protein